MWKCVKQKERQFKGTIVQKVIKKILFHGYTPLLFAHAALLHSFFSHFYSQVSYCPLNLENALQCRSTSIISLSQKTLNSTDCTFLKKQSSVIMVYTLLPKLWHSVRDRLHFSATAHALNRRRQNESTVPAQLQNKDTTGQSKSSIV